MISTVATMLCDSPGCHAATDVRFYRVGCLWRILKDDAPIGWAFEPHAPFSPQDLQPNQATLTWCPSCAEKKGGLTIIQDTDGALSVPEEKPEAEKGEGIGIQDSAAEAQVA